MIRSFMDMMGRKMEVGFPPRRIISVVPSQTELLSDLGLDAQVAGITKFCVHPEAWFRSKTRVGGTKKLDIEKIKKLRPDLIIANREENEKEQIDMLARHFPVWVSDVKTVNDALSMIRGIGLLTGTSERADGLAENIRSAFAALPAAASPARVAYFIWYNPWMSVGGDTFIHDMITRAGWQNVFADRLRYPEVSSEALMNARPDIVFLSSEPFPFREKHAAEIKAVLPHARVLLADGEMFSWYGSRMSRAVPYLKSLILRCNEP